MPLFRPYEHRRSDERDGSAALTGSLFPASDEDENDAESDHETVAEPTPPAHSPQDEVTDRPAAKRTRKSTSQARGARGIQSTAGESAAGSANGTTKTADAPRARLQPKGEKKDRPTRTRAEAERARREQLHPTLTPKEAKARNRELKFQARQDALTKQEATPERELLRDYIDSRWTVAEFILPVFVLLWATSLATVTNSQLQYILSLVMVVAIAAMFVNMWWLWRGFKREAQARLKHPNFRGLLMYGVNRMMWIRRFRRPPPRIPRGGEY